MQARCGRGDASPAWPCVYNLTRLECPGHLLVLALALIGGLGRLEQVCDDCVGARLHHAGNAETRLADRARGGNKTQ